MGFAYRNGSKPKEETHGNLEDPVNPRKDDVTAGLQERKSWGVRSGGGTKKTGVIYCKHDCLAKLFE